MDSLQLTIFDFLEERKESRRMTDTTLKVFEAFAGVGAQRMALRNLGIKHEVIGIAEIDKYAIQSYEAIHGPTKNYGDISKIDPYSLPHIDLFTYSFPCQDLSVAGQLAGLGKGTRSGLLYECEKIIEAKKPQYLLLENVKNLVGKKFKGEFLKWLEYLEGLGYSNYWQVLNAKDYNVPQNRERVFVVSILNNAHGYNFPQPTGLKKRLRDVLETEVEEKYYINKPFKMVTGKNVVAQLEGRNFESSSRIHGTGGYFQSLKAKDRQDNLILVPKISVAGELEMKSHKQTKQVLNVEGICTTITTGTGGHHEPKILEYRGETVELPCICASRGRNPENPTSRRAGLPTEQQLELNTHGVSNTLTSVQKDNYALTEEYRVRKLTPLECWRLMGFNDEDFRKAEAVCSNTQLYKQAGNSIVVDVLEGIFKELFL